MVRFERHNQIDFSPGAEMGSRIFRTFDVIYVQRGRIDFEIGPHRVSLGPGRAILIYPQTLFNGRSAGESRVCSLHFSIDPSADGLGPSLARLAGRENGFEVAVQAFSKREEWDILRAVQLATLEPGPLTHEVRLAQLVLILGQWQPKPSVIHAGPRYAREFRQLIEWLEGNLDRPITLDQMAARVGLSSSQFRQHFKEVIGSTPAQFFLNMRMDACKRLLLESDSGIKGIAQAVGFSDLPHFYRNFKKHTGRTPDQFRRNHV